MIFRSFIRSVLGGRAREPMQSPRVAEPRMTDWIHSFNPGEVFVDIGADSDLYSAYAGKVARVRVFAHDAGASLDERVERGEITGPDHIRIAADADATGAVQGMRRVLEGRMARTILIEAATRGIVEEMLGYGWVVSPSVMTEVKAGTLAGNIIFGRRIEDLVFVTESLRR